MIYTEIEAMVKACPLRIGSHRSIPINCVSSECMAWVWVKWKQVDGIREFSQKTEGCEPYKGRCGMVNCG